MPRLLFALVVAALGGLFVPVSATRADAPRAPWHSSLSLDGGDVWRQRVAISVCNETDTPLAGHTIGIEVGSATGIPIQGARAEALRACDGQGREWLLGLDNPQGEPVAAGLIAAGSRLSLPVECPANGSTVLYVYFDNPSAWPVPDVWPSRIGVVNGGVEAGTGHEPEGWTHDPPDRSHRATWSDESPHSGRRCLKLEVDSGAESTWISTRQRDLTFQPGGRYRLTAHVRARDVVGNAGWYIHVGTAREPLQISPMLWGGSGTYDWKLVSAEFTVPAGADRGDLGTVLHGTGTAWFDDVELERLDPPAVTTRVGPVETLPIQEIGPHAPWIDGPMHRAVAVVARLDLDADDQASPLPLAAIDLGILKARSANRLDPASIRVTLDGQLQPSLQIGDRLLVAADPRTPSRQTFHVYFDDQPSALGVDAEPTASSVRLEANLLRNPGFESGDEGWNRSGESDGVSFDTDTSGPVNQGRQAARLIIPASAPESWRGWTQDVTVEAGKTYLVSAQLRCQNLQGSPASLHIHFLKADGSLCELNPMQSAGTPISGTTDWTCLSGAVSAPPDAATLRLHLTTNGHGTLWHDTAFVAEVLPAHLAVLEHRSDQENAAAARLWMVPAIEKVFPDTVPGATAAGLEVAAISAARNERESLQLAFRSSASIKGLRLEIDPPVNSEGAALEVIDERLVGYVPVDVPTNYYQSNGPPWQRRVPVGSGQCDGWSGLWPDPLLPLAPIDLAARETRSFWLTLRVPRDAVAGDYMGQARLLDGEDQPVASLPITVHVWDFVLPDRPRFKAIYDARFGPLGTSGWADDPARAREILLDAMRDRWVCPDQIQPFPSFRYENGRASADFEAFDRAAERYFNEWQFSFSYMPMTFYIFGWGMPPSEFMGERPYEGQPPYANVDRSELRPAYKQAYQACLKLFWEHLQERGWQDRFVLYISDEPFYTKPEIRAQMVALCRMIHEVDPAIPIYSSTWHHVPEWDGSIDVWGLGHYGIVAPEQLAAIRNGGARVWFTTDGQMCLDTPFCAVERLLPTYAFHHGAEAYEFWGMAWHTLDPYRYGWHRFIPQSDAPGVHYWIRYPNGDGFLLYPGRPVGQEKAISTVRLEQARDGVEDYEYLALLRDRREQAVAAGRDVKAADQAIEASFRLVPIPNAGGRFSSRILPDPGAVETTRQAIARAIEQLAPSASR